MAGIPAQNSAGGGWAKGGHHVTKLDRAATGVGMHHDFGRDGVVRPRSFAAVMPSTSIRVWSRPDGKLDVRNTYTNFGQILSNPGAAFQRIPHARKRPLPVASRKPSSATRSWAARGVIFSSAAIMPAEAMGRASM